MPSYYDYSDYENENNFHGTTGFMYTFETFVIFPVIVILNLILLIKLLGNQKLRSEPWRWLVAHTSFCFMLIIFIAYNEFATNYYLKPSLLTTPLCPGIRVIDAVTWNMSLVSMLILAAERYRAVRFGREDGGGMNKKAVILSLVIFWLLLIVVYVVSVVAGMRGPSPRPPHLSAIYSCPAPRLILPGVEVIKLILWFLLSITVVIISITVFRSLNTASGSMKRSIAAPTLALCFFVMFSMLVPTFFYIFENLGYLHVNPLGHMLMFFTFLINYIAFPIIWLVTWSRNGDISWKQNNVAEQHHLLESK